MQREEVLRKLGVGDDIEFIPPGQTPECIHFPGIDRRASDEGLAPIQRFVLELQSVNLLSEGAYVAVYECPECGRRFLQEPDLQMIEIWKQSGKLWPKGSVN